MTRLLTTLFLAASLTLATGCNQPVVTNPTTLAPGYQNPQDQKMGEILAGAHALYLSVQQQSAAGTLTLSPTVKQSFNTFGVLLNSADSIYLAYHNGTATQTAAQNAVNAVQTAQANLPVVNK